MWYRKTYGKRVGIIGHKVNLAIGQGEVLTTPLQINAFYAAMANGGLWIQPHLLKQTVGRGRLTREQVIPMVKSRLPMSQAVLSAIRQGMWAVVNAPGGTGANARVSGGTVYGKTGSAENSMGKGNEKRNLQTDQGRKIAIDGYILAVDNSDLKAIAAEMQIY